MKFKTKPFKAQIAAHSILICLLSGIDTTQAQETVQSLANMPLADLMQINIVSRKPQTLAHTPAVVYGILSVDF